LRRIFFVLMSGLLIFLSATQADAQILHRRKKVNKSTSVDNTAEPDKVLYDRALDNIKHGRHEVGRLNLQTLINTYPDSEYLAKAKLAIADSYFKEGGTANMTQAIQGYKDFIVFFPFLPEAAYAQMQVAMAHYRQMEKPDRDRTHARDAEEEFQTFLQKYPKDPLVPKAEQRLRDVQELLAEGDFRIGNFYYIKGDRRAAAARLLSLTKRYPLYSRSDRALWMLGDIFDKGERKEIAATYYAQIVRNYPLSGYVSSAKTKLTDLKVPIPQPDPQAVAWMTAEQNAPRARTPLYRRPLSLVKSGPSDELQASAKSGKPNLEPEGDSPSATDILNGGSPARPSRTGTGTGIVATITPGSGASGSASTETSGAVTGTENSNTPAETAPEEGTPAAETTKPADDVTAPAATDSPASPGGSATPADTTPAPTSTDTAPESTVPAAGSAIPDPGDLSKANTNPQKESTSKKKKGLKRIVPW
jgi:outer membrane protein assembly factor BamD